MNPVLENYRAVLRRVEETARQCGRDVQTVSVLAVSKTFPAEDIRLLYDAGVRSFGENRIDELQRKAAVLPADVEWHFIGTVQSNKIAKIVHAARYIHSVTSLSHIGKIARAAEEQQKTVYFLLELNVSGEESKQGAAMADAPLLVRAAADCGEWAKFAGFMTMAPADADEEECEKYFSILARFRREAEQMIGRELPVLSMGMSGDYPAAIRQGATIVRIGSSIFGHRDYGSLH